ncbi:MAG: anaerobic ribonucleoside-triphosphate reductase activating protein [Nanobdellota archaeon]
MIISGFNKNSLIDYPNKISSVVFTNGCNFACHYCHNHHLIHSSPERYSCNEVFDFLKKRKGLIEAVTVSGGEPCLQKGLKDFISEVKKMGYLVKLDTNGSRPEVIKDLIANELIDYIAMDIKTSFKNYYELVPEQNIKEKIRKSVNLILASDIDYCFRTTAAPYFVSESNLPDMLKEITGAKKYFLQKFTMENCLYPDFFKEFKKNNLDTLKFIAEKFVKSVEVI